MDAPLFVESDSVRNDGVDAHRARGVSLPAVDEGRLELDCHEELRVLEHVPVLPHHGVAPCVYSWLHASLCPVACEACARGYTCPGTLCLTLRNTRQQPEEVEGGITYPQITGSGKLPGLLG